MYIEICTRTYHGLSNDTVPLSGQSYMDTVPLSGQSYMDTVPLSGQSYMAGQCFEILPHYHTATITLFLLITKPKISPR
jgi:hypothetical protein